ncbi:MAG: hypothetical protein NC390_02180 [Fusobacterium sp.]|nr:hypothetical protein [Fusobacterium sp.]
MDIKNALFGLLKKFKIVLIVFFTGLLILKAIELTHMRITAVFTELEPFSNLNVYYKGFKIGRAVKVVPSKDFLTTRVTIVLDSWSYNLPNNIKAKVQKRHKDSDIDYMEIIYPSSPALARIRYGDKIEGEISHDWNDLINNVTDGGGFDELKGNANNLMSSLNSTAKDVSDLLKQLNIMLKDIQPDINTAAHEISTACGNLNSMSKKLNDSIDEKYLRNSIANVHTTTKNFEGTTQIINTTTLPAVNATICSLKTLLDNVNEIVKGIGNTLKQRMGAARLMFGTPVKN